MEEIVLEEGNLVEGLGESPKLLRRGKDNLKRLQALSPLREH